VVTTLEMNACSFGFVVVLLIKHFSLGYARSFGFVVLLIKHFSFRCWVLSLYWLKAFDVLQTQVIFFFDNTNALLFARQQ